jgi:hypothetical protein
MATTTPNFGWPVPTSSDLVKNGATAIEGLGDAIDASLLDLKGGTTGQVLKKNTNTDMDFVWSADSAGMTNPMTTTGDTIYSSSGSTPARLGIGSTGQVLTVAGGVPTWATAGGGGSYTLVRSGSFSAAADTGTTFDSCFTTTYKNYVVVINLRGSTTTNTYFQARNGSTTRTANYFGSSTYWNSSGTQTTTSTSSVAQFTMGPHSSAADNIYSMTIGNVGTGSSSIPCWSGTFMGLASNQQGVFGCLVDNGAVNGFILSAASGTITGNAYVYGLGI